MNVLRCYWLKMSMAYAFSASCPLQLIGIFAFLTKLAQTRCFGRPLGLFTFKIWQDKQDHRHFTFENARIFSSPFLVGRAFFLPTHSAPFQNSHFWALWSHSHFSAPFGVSKAPSKILGFCRDFLKLDPSCLRPKLTPKYWLLMDLCTSWCHDLLSFSFGTRSYRLYFFLSSPCPPLFPPLLKFLLSLLSSYLHAVRPFEQLPPNWSAKFYALRIGSLNTTFPANFLVSVEQEREGVGG